MEDKLTEFEEEAHAWKDYLLAIILLPVALPMFLIRKLFDKFN